MNRAPCYDVPKAHQLLWREHAEGSAVAQRVAAEGERASAGWADAFLPELHHRLYAETPAAVETRGRAAAVRARLHDIVAGMPEFEALRRTTVRDPLWSGMAAASLGEALLPSLPHADEDGDKARAALDALEALADESPEMEAALADAMSRAQEAAEIAEGTTEDAAAGVDESAVRSALRRGIAQVSEEIADAQEALRVLGCGRGEGATSSMSPEVALQVARRVRGSKRLQDLVELAGRMILTARAKRAARTDYARSEVVGVEPTGDIAALLPSELMALSDPTMTAALYRRVLERSALGYRMAGSERSAKGPIVVVIDQSSSMGEGHRDTWAKAVALALLDAAVAQRRAFGIVLYNGGVMFEQVWDPAKVSPLELIDVLSTAPSGGTRWAPALRAAETILRSVPAFKTADVIHITDGDADVDDGLLLARGGLLALGATTYGIAIGAPTAALAKASDSVVRIDDVSADSAAVDLIFDAV